MIQLSVSRYNLAVLERAVLHLAALPASSAAAVRVWWAALPPLFFLRVVGVLQAFLAYLAQQAVDDRLCIVVTRHLATLFAVNEERDIVPTFKFYAPALMAAVPLRDAYVRWRDSASAAVFSFLHYPFLFPAAAKRELLIVAAREQMQLRVRLSSAAL